MTPKERLVTVREGADKDTVRELLHKHRIERVLIVDGDFNLKGMMTVNGHRKGQGLSAGQQGRSGSFARGRGSWHRCRYG